MPPRGKKGGNAQNNNANRQAPMETPAAPEEPPLPAIESTEKKNGEASQPPPEKLAVAGQAEPGSVAAKAKNNKKEEASRVEPAAAAAVVVAPAAVGDRWKNPPRQAAVVVQAALAKSPEPPALSTQKQETAEAEPSTVPGGLSSALTRMVPRCPPFDEFLHTVRQMVGEKQFTDLQLDFAFSMRIFLDQLWRGTEIVPVSCLRKYAKQGQNPWRDRDPDIKGLSMCPQGFLKFYNFHGSRYSKADLTYPIMMELWAVVLRTVPDVIEPDSCVRQKADCGDYHHGKQTCQVSFQFKD